MMVQIMTWSHYPFIFGADGAQSCDRQDLLPGVCFSKAKHGFLVKTKDATGRWSNKIFKLRSVESEDLYRTVESASGILYEHVLTRCRPYLLRAGAVR